MKKRLITLALTLIMAMSLSVTAFAYDNDMIWANLMANELYSKGLFKGTGTNVYGKPIYDLEANATRSQAVTMFVRVLGKGDEATQNAGTYKMPFTDIPEWAKGAIGYAYTNGYTVGTSDTTFSPDSKVTLYQYLTFCLRALGYEEGTDFYYSNPCDLAVRVGLLEHEVNQEGYNFQRADMVVLSYKTLFATRKNADKTFGDELGMVATYQNDSAIFKITPVIVDANDPNGEHVNINGTVTLTELPEGTVIHYDGLEYNPNMSPEENISNFVRVLNELDGDAHMDRGMVKVVNKGIYLGYSSGKYYLTVSPTWGVNYTKSGFSTAGSKTPRNLALNAMAVLGDESMAKAVYGMVDEHYRFRLDNSVPITDELAAKYGLTINNVEVDNNTGYVHAYVSDGTHTWEIVYYIDNSLGNARLNVIFSK